MRSRPFWFLESTRAQCGKRFTFNALAHPPLVFIAGAEEAAEVYAAPADVLMPGEGGQAIAPIVGEQSFMLADGELHRRGRGRLTGLFTRDATARHTAMVRDLAEREVADWPRDAPLELHDRLRALTLRVILMTLFGSQASDEPALLPKLLSMLSISGGTTLTLAATRNIPSIRGRWRRFLRERDDVDRILYRLIEARREDGRRADDALGVLTASRDERGELLSNSYIRDTLMSLILAGHETTSAELAWAFQLLAHDEHVQGELASALRDDDASYLAATVQEVLRFRPVFLFAIPRAVRAPIKIGDWTHSPPAHLLVCLYLIHHDPDLFDQPHRFDPERFLDVPAASTSWMPWGGGGKRCPGHRLATLELETIVRAVVRASVIQPTTRVLERPRWRSVIVAPHQGCRVVLRRRR